MADENIADMREAIVIIRDMLINGGHDAQCRAKIVTICNTVLSAPPRNCDRFRTADEVSAYWGANVHAVPLHGDAYAMRIGGREFATFLDWLFASAEGGAE